MTFSSASLSTFDNRNSSVSCGLSSASPNFNRENRSCDMFKLTCFFKKCRTLSIPKIIFVVLLVCLMTSTIHAKKAQDGMNLQFGNFDLKSQAESEREKESQLKCKSDDSFKFDDLSLRVALDLWFRRRVECEIKYGAIGKWDTSGVTNMHDLFQGRKTFNHDISKWDVSNVTNMEFMFWGASLFNQPLNSWNVSKVTNMAAMFDHASSFNQSLSSWNVSRVTNVMNMFSGAFSFRQSLESWDKYPNMWIRNAMKLWLTDRSAAKQKYGNIEEWDTSNVTDMSWLLQGFGNTDEELISKFNEDLSKWNVSRVTNMASLFWGGCSFNQSLSAWNVSQVTNMNSMFWGASSFNQSLSDWNVSQATNMEAMFNGASSFNQSLESWDKYPNTWIRNAMKLWLTDRSAAKQKYGNIEEWDTSNVTDMSWLLQGFGNTYDSKSLISKFNEDLSKWNVSRVTNLSWMFYRASSFNQSLSAWNVSRDAKMTNMFWGASSFNLSINAPWYHK